MLHYVYDLIMLEKVIHCYQMNTTQARGKQNFTLFLLHSQCWSPLYARNFFLLAFFLAPIYLLFALLALPHSTILLHVSFLVILVALYIVTLMQLAMALAFLLWLDSIIGSSMHIQSNYSIISIQDLPINLIFQKVALYHG